MQNQTQSIKNSSNAFSLEIASYIWATNLNTIHEENDVIETGELARVKAELKQGKHTCLIMRMEHPRAYTIH